MDPDDDLLDGIEFSFLYDADDKERISEEGSGRPNQDGEIAAGTLIASTGETEHQATHDQANEAVHGPSSISPEAATTQLNEMKNKVTQKSTTSHVGKKRRGPPLDDEEKKERKKEADLRYRNKIKADIEDTKKELQDAQKKVERLERTDKLLNEEKNSMFQKLQDAATQIGKLQCEIIRLNETIVDQQKKLDAICLNQDHVRKMEEELRGLKKKCCELESMNASLVAEKDTMTKDLQIAATNSEELEIQIFSLNQTITQQRQLVNMFSNKLNKELLKEQEQLGQEENERVGLEGDGRPIIGKSSGSEIQSVHSEILSHQIEKFKREAGEAIRNVCTETTKQMLEVLAEMRAVEARMAEHVKSRNV